MAQTRRDPENLWRLFQDFITKNQIADFFAVFHTRDLAQPVHSNCLGKHSWGQVGKHLQSMYCGEGVWTWTFSEGENFLFHLEKKTPFTEEEICVLTILAPLMTGKHETETKALDVSLTTSLPPEEKEENDAPRARHELAFPYPDIIGESAKLVEVLGMLDKISGRDIPVLIQGESGTGKELIAKAIHHYSPRQKKPFVSENCAAIPETLLESELFGYRKGSFTGAYQDKVGLFELAHEGTLFLDEVGDMSLGMQKKLLRALQEGEIRPIGAKKVVHVDVRILAATNKNLKEAMCQGLFREDLYYRLNVMNLKLPPLRDRKEDIVLLFQYFLNQVGASMKMIHIPTLSEEVKNTLVDYSWPGNIREMQNEVKRLLALVDAEVILPNHLSFVG